MTMNRGIIRMTEGGKVSMPLIDVWMTREEIADMFGLPEASIIRAICSIYKKSELYEHETMRRIPFPRHEHQSWTMEVYNYVKLSIKHITTASSCWTSASARVYISPHRLPASR